MALPMVAGHECAGVVEAVGEGVTRVKVGDHVVGTWMIPCGECPECRSGRGNVCTGNFPQFVAGTMLDGTTPLHGRQGQARPARQLRVRVLATHGGARGRPRAHPQGRAPRVGVPHELLPSPPAGARSPRSPTCMPGDSVAIWGMGGIGQNILRAAKLRQANPLIAIDVEEARRSHAMELGATHFINSSKEDPVPIIQELTGGGADFASTPPASPGAYEQVIWCSRHGRQDHRHRHHGRRTKWPSCRSRSSCLQQKSIIGGLYGSVSVQDDIPKLIDDPRHDRRDEDRQDHRGQVQARADSTRSPRRWRRASSAAAGSASGTDRTLTDGGHADGRIRARRLQERHRLAQVPTSRRSSRRSRSRTWPWTASVASIEPRRRGRGRARYLVPDWVRVRPGELRPALLRHPVDEADVRALGRQPRPAALHRRRRRAGRRPRATEQRRRLSRLLEDLEAKGLVVAADD